MPVVTTAEYVVMVPRIRQGPALYRPDPDTIVPVFHVRIWPDPACVARGSFSAYPMLRERKFTMLVKVFPIKLQNGLQDKVEAVVREFAPKGPGTEDGTLVVPGVPGSGEAGLPAVRRAFRRSGRLRRAHELAGLPRPDRRPVREHDRRFHRTRPRAGRRPVEPAALRRQLSGSGQLAGAQLTSVAVMTNRAQHARAFA